jgi:hypothetical protein
LFDDINYYSINLQDIKQDIKQDIINEIILYTTKNGEVKIDVLYSGENIWLTQKKIALLFGVNVRTISEHLKNIFESDELTKDSVCRNFRRTAVDGKNYTMQAYNLDAIIAVGYRVNSKQATEFRVWATKILKDFIIKCIKDNSIYMANDKNKLPNQLNYLAQSF